MNGIEQIYSLIERVSKFLSIPDLVTYLEEIKVNKSLITSFEDTVRDVDHFKTKSFTNIFDFSFYRLLLYSLVRVRSPRNVVETGVMHGLTSTFILEALKQNNFGKLISIDYPSYFESGPSNRDGYTATLPPGKEPGWIVDELYKNRWDLWIGKSCEILPKISSDELPIDIFFHDSEHTYETMTLEMEFAWQNLSRDGILIVDNIDGNSAFSDFCIRVAKDYIELPSPNNEYSDQIRLGLVVK